MDDRQLLDELLTRQESDELDFKSQQYKLTNDHTRSKFIKDILAMANTSQDWFSLYLVGSSGTIRQGDWDSWGN